jgi:hypothetical protein
MKVGQNESIRFTLDFETEFKVLNGGWTEEYYSAGRNIYILLVMTWDGIHLVRRSLFGLLNQLRKMMMSIEQMIEWELPG